MKGPAHSVMTAELFCMHLCGRGAACARVNLSKADVEGPPPWTDSGACPFLRAGLISRALLSILSDELYVRAWHCQRDTSPCEGLCMNSSRTPSDIKAVPKHCTCQPPSSAKTQMPWGYFFFFLL